MSETGNDVFLLVPGFGRDYQVEGTRIRLHTVPASKRPFGVASFIRRVNRSIPKLAAEENIDLVHFTFDYPTYAVATDRFKRPVVATAHHLHTVEDRGRRAVEGGGISTLGSTIRSSFLTMLEGKLLRKASSVIAISRFTADCVIENLGVRPEKVRVIHHGLELEKFAGQGDSLSFRRSIGAGEENLVTFVGRLEPSKGVAYLIRAFGSLRSRHPGSRLVIVGEGSAARVDALKRLVSGLGLTRDVSFLGRVGPEVLLNAYAASYVVVLPSLMEGFGLTLLESMAASKPCVASSVGGVPEIVRDGETGILVPPGDSSALAEALSRLLADPKLASTMGRNGGAHVRQEFSAAGMIKQTADLYRETVDSAAEG